MSYHIEFPDYGKLPGPMPRGMRDVSWKNDACPSFAGYGLRLWIDYEDEARRELPGPRYVIVQVDRDLNAISDHAILTTDDWDEVLRYVDRWQDPYAPPREYRVDDRLGTCETCGAVDIVIGCYILNGEEVMSCVMCEVRHIESGAEVKSR